MTGNYKYRSLVILLAPALIVFVHFSCKEQEPEKKSELKKADSLIESAIEDSLFPGAVLLVGTSEEILHLKAYGHAVMFNREGGILQNPETMSTGHLFDIASLTKIFATTFGLMLLHSRGHLDVDTPVSDYLPEFETDEKRIITIRHLLTHTSGLVQWFPTYYTSNNNKDRRQFIAEQSLINDPGAQHRYSDPGFMVLADLIEIITAEPLDQFLSREVYSPLELSATLFNPGTDLSPGVTATSHGNPFEKRMVYDDNFGYTVDVDPESWDGWREYVLLGEVNDGNAFHTHNGVAGHAGLFSTAEELYRIIKILLKRGQYKDSQLLTPETINLFLTPDRFGHGLGFIMDAPSLNATELPEGSFGHTGFTGTNFVVVPEYDIIIILLTNRQHFGVDADGTYPDLRKLRGEIFEIVSGSRQ